MGHEGNCSPNLGLAPKCDMIFRRTESISKSSVLSPSKYAKMRFQPGHCPGPRWGSSWCSPNHLVGWKGDTPPIPHPSILSPLALTTKCSRLGLSGYSPKYFPLEPCLGWRVTCESEACCQASITVSQCKTI